MAVLVVGTALSFLAAEGWRSTVRDQRDGRLDRTAASRTVTICAAGAADRAPAARTPAR